MSKKLTAVEWFLNELLKNNIIEIGDVDIDTYSKAKELEKQQIIDARQDGFNKCFRKGDRKEITNEQYYKENYEQ
jgi:hypothetical protein